MENSFFEYRDKTGVDSDSDSEIIDNSLEAEESFTAKKKLTVKNQTVFVAESEESYSDDDSDKEDAVPIPKTKLRKYRLYPAPHIISSSEDDASRRESIKQLSLQKKSFSNVVLSSSDEEIEEASPEILPKRRPPMKPKSSDSSDSPFIGCKKNKRLMRVESDADNSIIIEHKKHNKMPCLKDTPLKVDDNKMALRKKMNNDSIIDTNESEDEDKSDKESGDSTYEQAQSGEDSEGSNDEGDQSIEIGRKTNSRIKRRAVFDDSDDSNDEKDQNNDKDQNDQSDDEADQSEDRNHKNNASKQDDDNKVKQSDASNLQSDDEVDLSDDDDDEDDGPDEDEMVMSRATRMSIMGVIPKGGDDTDESDFIQSDEKSRSSSANSLNELPDVTINKPTPQKSAAGTDTSRISCSPFGSPLQDITNEINQIEDSYESKKPNLNHKEQDLKSRVLNNLLNRKSINVDSVKLVPISRLMPASKENVDDDVTIVEDKPEIIALSSDDDDDVQIIKPAKKSPKEESTSSGVKNATLKQYLTPASYPGQVVYVKRHVRENELRKLEKLKEDIYNVRHLLENMEMESLPDGGARLIERLTSMEQMLREQGDKVANMVVEPDMPSAEEMARDGFQDRADGLSWDELQKASQAVQPRMFGKQAMATHMAERNLILDRLGDLHKSLASCPPESSLASAPPVMKTKMMPHQLHALAWLRWRETQRPCGGILADDMGLGKTITMISLVVSDKDGKLEEDDDDDDARAHTKFARGGTLVVCPASLMQQWSGEVTKHCSAHAASVCLHHGAQRATHPHRLATYDMVLTTYNILQRDNEKNGVLMKVVWRRIILDEAHIVRNHKSATSTAVSALKGKRRWCLTGTPVQNKDLDLFALLKFLRCTPFDELTMWKKWIDNKGQGGQERLSTIMRCILLRRTKVQLQQKGQLDCLPERTTHLQEVTLSKEEMNVYQKVLVFSKTLFAQFLHQRAEKQADYGELTGKGRDTAYAAMHKKMIALQGAKPVKSHEILVLLLRLRQVCCHCGLIAAMLDEETAGDAVDMDPGGQDLLAELNKLSLEDSRSKRKSGNQDLEEEKQEEEKEQEGTTVAEAIRSVLSPNNPVFQLTRQSSKIRAVMECLQQNVFNNKGHKAVVVSQWTAVLRLVEKELEQTRIKCVTLSGNVPVPARPPLIQKLNDPSSEVRVMLLSLCAGGVGLNLCGANHLLLLDPHWNPQLEEQAQDRIYRVGQSKPVNIYRFMCVDTVEQSIRKLQLAKLELAENVLTGAKNTNNSKLTIEDLKVLFNMGPPAQTQPGSDLAQDDFVPIE